MDRVSRREFIKLGGIASAVLLSSRLAIPATIADGSETLVVGDSLVWGQGLLEEDKIYTRIRSQLRSDLPVGLKVKAHSGATLKLHKETADRLRRGGRDESQALDPEINVAFPSITKQIELAADEYAAEGIPPGSIRLILLSGGISDIGVSNLLGASDDVEELYSQIEEYCFHDMSDVLTLASSAFPRARIAVLGYFPMVSPETPSSRMINAELEIRRLHDPLKPLVNNPITRRFLRKSKDRAVERSRIWFEESNKHFQRAVNAVNKGRPAGSAMFVKSPLTEENAYATPDTMLFRMSDGKTNDFRYADRKATCKTQLDDLRSSTGGKHSTRLCEIAAIGHLDPEGARRYAEAIVAFGSLIARRS